MSNADPAEAFNALSGLCLVLGLAIGVVAILRHVWGEYGMFWVAVALIVMAFFFAGMSRLYAVQAGPSAVERVEDDIDGGE